MSRVERTPSLAASGSRTNRAFPAGHPDGKRPGRVAAKTSGLSVRLAKAREIAHLLVPALVGWALCGATIAIVRLITSLQNALLVHAVAAPIIFAAASFVYFRGFHHTTPLQTAMIYVSLVITLDFIVIATFVEKSYAMFASTLGTWIPFALIFGATYLMGRTLSRNRS